MTEQERHSNLLIRLEAAMHFLRGAPFHDAARELVYLGLEEFDPDERQGVIADVLAEFQQHEDDEQERRPAQEA